MAKSSELAARLNALPESSSRTYLRSLLAQRGNELNSIYKDMHDAYMGLPEVDAFLNTELVLDTLASRNWAKGTKGKSRQSLIGGAPGEEALSELQSGAESQSRSELGPESKSQAGLAAESKSRSELGSELESPEFGSDSKVLAFKAIPQVEKSRLESTPHSEFVESNAYLSRLQEIANDPGSVLDGIRGIVNRPALEAAIKSAAANVQERMNKDPLTLPEDLFGQNSRSFAWSVLWESLRQTGDFDQFNNIMKTRNINENEISAALIAHSVGQPLSTYPTLESIITKLCPRERVAMFSMPFEALNGGREPVSFPVSMDTFNHHFGREIQAGVRVVDPPHIYKSHIVWEFFNGRLPEGMFLARTESRLVGHGLEFTLDYDKAHKTGKNGLPAKFRKPIKIVVERVDTDQGSRWQYKTHYERD